ncbi:MAG TPA: hypothetical protein VEW03_01905 [Longimicrobiaceae bacterium]|nr:hypothetical protein [Longimicrobiaceae bacterium]
MLSPAVVPVPDPGQDVPRPHHRDPWIAAGLAVLAVLTAGAILLYRSAPQSAAEVRGATWVAVAPDAFTPRISRARERVSAALRAGAAGDTAGALARYAEAEEEALLARGRAGDSAQVAASTELWAAAALDRAQLMLAAGARPWYRGDDNQRLAEALAVVRRVAGAPVSAAARQRADALGGRIARELRTGPLEWLPR